MKITDRLLGDHKTFRKMSADLIEIIKQPVGARNPTAVVRLVELYRDHIVLHAWLEDNFFFPHLTKMAFLEGSLIINQPYMAHLDNEHHTIEQYLETLIAEVKKDPIDPSWPQTFALFDAGLQSHLRKEETELFPEAERLLGEARLEELSDEMEKEREKKPGLPAEALAKAGSRPNNMPG